MRSGKYNRRICIQEPTFTRGSAGGLIPWWAVFSHRWAAVLPVQGAEFFTADQIKSEILTRFQIRHTPGITTKMRIITQSRAFDIEAAMNVAGRNRETEIVAKGDPEGAPRFQYANISVAAGAAAYQAEITWDTDAFASSQVRYRKEGAGGWTTIDEWDSPEGLLEHLLLITGLDGAENYEAEIRSFNADRWTPGWQDTLTWGIDTDGTFLPDGYIGIPTILTGPFDTSTLDGAIITCTTDVDAYMQVRTRKINPLGDWVNHDWTVTPSTSPSKTVAGLDSEHEGYYHDIRVSANADGSNPGEWTPGDNSEYFYTLCSGVFSYSNFVASKSGFGKIWFLRITWDTTVEQSKDRMEWGVYPNFGNDSGWKTTSGTSHRVDDTDFEWREDQFQYRVRNRNNCSQDGSWSATQYFYVDADGQPHPGMAP